MIKMEPKKYFLLFLVYDIMYESIIVLHFLGTRGVYVTTGRQGESNASSLITTYRMINVSKKRNDFIFFNFVPFKKQIKIKEKE